MFVVLCILTAVSLFTHQFVYAQEQTTIAVSPATGTVLIGGDNLFSAEILVTNAIDLYGFDVTFSYDPSVISLDSWELGGMLAPLSKLIEENTPGHLRLVFTQYGVEPVDGDGTLLVLNFTGLTLGTSVLSIDKAVFSTDTGSETNPIRQNGTFTTAYDPDFLNKVSVTGNISLQGQVDRGGIPVRLGVGEEYEIGPYDTVSIDQAGQNLDFGEVVTDTYPITTHQPRYLNIHEDLGKVLILSGEPKSMTALQLIGGNAVWSDNVINIGDLSLVGAQYGITIADLAPGETLDADVNFDDVVDLRDLALAAGNFDMDSSTAYEEWLP